MIGQFLDGGTDGLLEIGGLGGGKNALAPRGLLFARVAAPLLARLVARGVDDEAQDPWFHGGFSPVLRRAAQDLDKGGLNGVLRVGRIPAKAKRRPVRGVGMPREQDVHRLPVVPLAERPEQGRVIGLA